MRSRCASSWTAGAIKDDQTLGYTWTGDHEVSWTLVKSQMLRSLDGSYVLRPAGLSATEVTYRLTVDVKIPMLGMIKRKAEKVIIDRALAGLKKRVESGDAGEGGHGRGGQGRGRQGSVVGDSRQGDGAGRRAAARRHRPRTPYRSPPCARS